jgi:hypothetical protein
MGPAQPALQDLPLGLMVPEVCFQVDVEDRDIPAEVVVLEQLVRGGIDAVRGDAAPD